MTGNNHPNRRTKITTDGRNNVTVERANPSTGEHECTTYFVPYLSGGKSGYVRVRDTAGRYPQVCEKLYSTGNTLMATPSTLLDVIRSELRRRVAAEKRDLNY
jgi:hypothetical protein